MLRRAAVISQAFSQSATWGVAHRPAPLTLLSSFARYATPWLGVLFAPLALAAFSLSLWSLASQMALAGAFPIEHGALADWRVWLLFAGILEGAAVHLRTLENRR